MNQHWDTNKCILLYRNNNARDKYEFISSFTLKGITCIKPDMPENYILYIVTKRLLSVSIFVMIKQ